MTAAAPLAIPAFVHSYAWVSIAPSLHGLSAGVLVVVLAYFPFLYLPVAASLRGLDPALEDVAASLGLAPSRIFLSGGVADCVLGRIAVDDVGYEGHARIMLRPEQVQISAADSGNSDGARWRVEQLDFEGFSSLITIRAINGTLSDGPSSLTMRSLSTQALKLGAKIKIAVVGSAYRMPF
jgi:hypothetical protein